MKRLLGTALVAGALLVVAGCGDDKKATETSAQTGTAPAVATASEVQKKKIEADVKKAGDEGAGAANSGDAPGSGVVGCGDGLYVGPNTTCPFAENVRNAFEEDPEGGDYSVFSPVTGQTYPMTCVPGADFPHACTGGNNASVFF